MSAVILNPLAMEGRTILVTGASSGIGRETAVWLSQLGARVVLAGRNRERLQDALARLHGQDHIAEEFNLDDCDAIPDWIKGIVARTGPLAGLVHSAGVQQTAPIQMLKQAKIESVLRTNLTSAIMLVKGFRQKNCAIRGGSIVLVSSGAGLVGRPALSVYSASKAALMGFTRSAAAELAAEGLRVNCVAPGYVETEMIQQLRETISEEQFAAIESQHPLGIGRPADVAAGVAFLLADASRWITGTTLVIDGGYTAI